MVASSYGEMQDLMEKILEERYANQEKEKEFCIELLQTAERENSFYCIAFAHTYLGDYYTSQNNCVEGGKHLDKAKRLSEENGFYDLLPRIFNLCAICYEFLGDEMSAMQYYLRAIEVVKSTDNDFVKAILMNNIASILGGLKDFTTAKEYYVKACNHFESIVDGEQDFGYVKLRIWSNFAQNLGELGELDEMKKHLLNCEQLRGDFVAVQKYALCRGWCQYYKLVGDTSTAERYVKELLEYTVQTELSDKIIIYEILVSVCHMMLDLGKKELSERLLQNIFTGLSTTDPDQLRHAQKLKVQFYEKFGTAAEKSQAYEEFFHKSDALEKSICEMKTRGIKHLIYINELQNSLEQETKQLSDEAHLDELTQSYNRRYFNKLISKAFTSDETLQIGFIIMDVDYFKEYNDTYGHICGDNVLKSLAGILAEHASDSIIPSRYGGDEFMVLCVNINVSQMIDYINKVFASLMALNIEHKGSKCCDRVTISVGFATSTIEEAESADSITDKADLQLYRSKAAGRNLYRYDAILD